jgi:hypothetical protein
MVNFYELQTIFSNPTVDIPIFYGESSKNSVTAKFMYNHILFAQTIYHLSDAATAVNFKLSTCSTTSRT